MAELVEVKDPNLINNLNQKKEKGFFSKSASFVKDLVSGDKRTEFKNLPELSSASELPLDSRSFKVGTGMFFYLDKSNRDNRNKVYYTFQPNKNFNFKYGDSIKLLLNNQEVYSCFKLEKKLLRVDSSIILYNKSKKKVKVVQSSKNFFYVNGLQDGDSILLNQD